MKRIMSQAGSSRVDEIYRRTMGVIYVLLLSASSIMITYTIRIVMIMLIIMLIRR